VLLQVFYECGDQADTVSYKSCCEGTMDPRGQELPGNRYERSSRTKVNWRQVYKKPILVDKSCPEIGTGTNDRCEQTLTRSCPEIGTQNLRGERLLEIVYKETKDPHGQKLNMSCGFHGQE
jgi:hypothetical protein